MILVKFVVASFRETDRIEQSDSVYFGGKKGIEFRPNPKCKVWDYEITDTDGKVWYVHGAKKRWRIREGETIMSKCQNTNWVNWRLTEVEFNEARARKIDWLKANTNEVAERNTAEINRLRAL